MFSGEFEQFCELTDTAEGSLGHGGSSVHVKRCVDRATKKAYAAKRLSIDEDVFSPYLLDNEMHNLPQINDRKIPRVVKFITMLPDSNGDPVFVLELIKGRSLRDSHIDRSASCTAGERGQHEQYVLDVTAQLLQTVYSLHTVGGLCHLDISNNNVMLRTDKCKHWDQLRLIDFGFSQRCSSDPFAKDIAPQGATLVYAAPEVLQFLQLHHERGGSDDVGVYINGPAADYWNVGILLFELLTGEVPFDSKDSLAAGSTPARVRSGHESRWAGYEAMLQMLKTWVDARTLAEETGSQVQHPLLDKVRQCSTNPEQAVAFFCQILSPKPHIRRQAIHHAWCAEMVGRMFKETRTSYPPDNAPDDYFSEEDAGCMPASCEALSGCFSCFLPKVQDDNKAARQQAREEERLRQQQEKLSGPPIGQQTASGPEPGSQSSKVRSRFKSAASKVKSAASKVTHLFTQPSKHSGTEPLPATVPAMNGLGYGNPGASVAALDPVPHSDQAVQTKPAYSGDGSSGAAVISLAALSTGHPQRSHQPCSMKRQTEVPVGSQLEQSNGATTHALFLEGGFQFDAQSAPSAEVGEPSVPTNGANADRPKAKRGVLKRLVQTGKKRSTAFLKLVHRGQS